MAYFVRKGRPRMPYFLLIVAVAVNAAANVLLKTAAVKGVSLSMEGGVLAFVGRNGLTLIALAAFALNVGFYFLALRSLPLSVAYPIMVAGTFLLVNGSSVFLLHEGIQPAQIAGYLLIVAGVALVLTQKASV